MTKTILEEYIQAYSEQLVYNSNLISRIMLLEKRLEIATRALKEYAEIETDDWIDSQEVAKKAIKEMEGVK